MIYISENKEYMLDWDYEKNNKSNLSPETIKMSSKKRVYWKCHICSGQWNTVVKDRRGCPYCAGFKALQGFNDLETTNPELIEQWDYDKNTELTPNMVTRGSRKIVWWKCEKNHSWDASVYVRVKGQGCPICNNRRVLVGYNDLKTVNNILAAEWNYEKNFPKTPEDFVYGSKEKVWWKCNKGHEWQAQIIHRYNGTGCPVCANRIIVKQYNDFASEHPELLREWDYNKNEKLPSEYACFSRNKVWWICSKGHSWKASIGDRSKGTGCAKCSEERRVSFPEKAVLYYITRWFPEVKSNYRAEWLGKYELDIYLEHYRIAVEYDGIYGHSTDNGLERDRKKNFVCRNNNVTLIRIREHGCSKTDDNAIDYLMESRNSLKDAIEFVLGLLSTLTGRTDIICDIDIERDSSDIYSLIEYSEKENSLGKKAPEIAKLWHPNKNGRLTPDLVQVASSKKVWWLGECGHEWNSMISYEVSSGKCPFCTGKRVLVGFNDLETISEDIAKEWDYSKNKDLLPSQVTAGSGKKVWWKCSLGHSWNASIVSRVKGNGCPICANREVLKGYNDLKTKNPRLAEEWNGKRNMMEADDVCYSDTHNAWWICTTCNHEWRTSPAYRMMGRGCPNCAEQERRITFQKTMVERNGSLYATNLELMQDWDYEKNTVNPKEISVGYQKKVFWKCHVCEHQWEATVTSRNRGNGCPLCARKTRVRKRRETLLSRKKPITETHKELINEWNFDLNILKPNEITAGSGKKVWWKCKKCNRSWQAVVGERTRGRGKCPFC